MDTIPPVSTIDISSYPNTNQQITKPSRIRADGFSIPQITSSKCKFQLPCGRCELTKELCTYDYG